MTAWRTIHAPPMFGYAVEKERTMTCRDDRRRLATLVGRTATACAQQRNRLLVKPATTAENADVAHYSGRTPRTILPAALRT